MVIIGLILIKINRPVNTTILICYYDIFYPIQDTILIKYNFVYLEHNFHENINYLLSSDYELYF
jgi:hypothetical protein